MSSQQERIALVALNVIYVFITLALVLNRLYVRTITRATTRGLNRVSDILVVIAWLFFVLLVACAMSWYFTGMLLVQNAVPSADEDISSEQRSKMDLFLKTYLVAKISFYIPLYCVKGAILCFLLELTPAVLRKIRIAIWVGVCLCTAAFVFTISSYLFSCGVVTGWSGQVFDYAKDLQQDCKVAHVTLPMIFALHVFTDIYLYTIPFFIVRQLTILTNSQRLATYGMFGAGFIMVFFGVSTFIAPTSLSWVYWRALHEQFMAFTVACLPAARITYLRMFKPRTVEGRIHNTPSDGSRKRKSLWVQMQRGVVTTRELDRVEEDDKSEKLSHSEGLHQMESGESSRVS